MSATALATVSELPVTRAARKPRTPKPATPATDPAPVTTDPAPVTTDPAPVTTDPKPATPLKEIAAMMTRNGDNPADVAKVEALAKPETPATDPKQVAVLESIAAKQRNAGVAKLAEFARTVGKLAAIRAWTVTDVTAKAYFRALGVGGDNVIWQPSHRQIIIRAIWDADNTTSLETYMAATATGERTVKRDKTACGAVNQARVDGQKSDNDGDGDSGSESSDGDVTPPVTETPDPFKSQRAMLAKIVNPDLADMLVAAGRGPDMLNAIAASMAAAAAAAATAAK